MTTAVVPHPHERALDQFIARRLPAWLTQRGAYDPTSMLSVFDDYRRSQAQVDTLLGRLPAPEAFARDHLQRALIDRLGLHVDLTTALWRVGGHARTAPQPLPALARLLRNFVRGAHFAADAALLDAPGGRVLTSDLQAVARLCRELDVGQRYQATLTTVFDQAALHTLAQHERQRLRLSLEIALRQGRVQPGDASLLGQLLPVQAGPYTQSRYIRCSTLEVLGCTLSGALVFDLRGRWSANRGFVEHAETQVVLLFLPHLGTAALQRFADWSKLSAWVGDHLRDPAQRDGWLSTVALAQRAGFLARLTPRLRDARTDPSARRIALHRDPFVASAAAFIARASADAAVRVVPTAALDHAQDQLREDAIHQAGWTLFNLVGGFVPVLGELLLAHAVVQTLDEVFEGVRSWTQGHRHEAMSHLLSVAQDVSLNVVVGAGLGAALRRVVRAVHLDKLIPVHTASGPRLWQADLSAFESAPPPEALLQNNGLLSDGEGWWWRDGAACYAVERQPSGQWRLRDPSGHTGFAPALLHNGQFAWQLAHRGVPAGMHVSELLGHLYPRAWAWEAARIEAVLRVMALSPDDLERCLRQRRPLSAALHDTLDRFALDQRTAHWLSESALLETARRPELQSILLRLDVLHASPADQIDALRTHSEQVRSWLFHLGWREGRPGSPAIRLVQRDFPGLSQRAAEALLAALDEPQLQRLLTTHRLPLALAEQARNQMLAQRARQMIEALYLHAAPNQAGIALCFGLLRRHAQWPISCNLEVRVQSVHGACLARLFPDAERTALVLVQRDQGFVLAPGEGASAAQVQRVEMQEGVPMPFTQALVHALPSEQCQRLGWVGALAGERLRADLQRWLPGSDQEVLTLAGLPLRVRGNRLPQRQADGRWGYALSGRGAARHPVERTLRDRLRLLYPDISEAQLDVRMVRLQAMPGGPLSWLMEQERTLRRLEVALRVWQEEGSSAVRVARGRVADRLRACWQCAQIDGVGLSGRELDLGGTRVGSLPPLPVQTDFSHVRMLRARHAGLGELPARFLDRFTQLRRLDLSHNHLIHLPNDLVELTALESLHLDANMIRLNVADVACLRDLRQLRTLSLNGNPLGDVRLQLGQLFRLTQLQLQDCRLRELPAGVIWCGALQRADLRNNQIASISPVLMHAPVEFRRAFWLSGNPLPLEVRQRFSGLGEGAVAGGEVPTEPDLVRARWLEGLSAGDRQARDERWRALQAEPNAGAFFQLLGELLGSADFRHTRAELEQRVWRVLDAAAEQSELRAALFDLAVHERTCVDGAMTCFNLLEVRVFVAQALRDNAHQNSETGLIELGRRLFRLDRVEAFAREAMQRRPPVPAVDEVEVSLAYRTGLASRLQLPGQASGMQFQQLAAVSADDLDAAFRFVRSAEQGNAFLDYLSAQDFWQSHLRAHHAEAFEAEDRVFWEALETLEGQQATLQQTTYLAQARTLSERREEAAAGLVLRLTREALSRVQA